MRNSGKRSRLSIDVSGRDEYIPNAKTAADLDESEDNKGVISFSSPLEMFQYLGLLTTCLSKKSQRTSRETSKKRGVKKMKKT